MEDEDDEVIPQGAYLVFLEEFLEVVGAGGEDAAMRAELDVLHHHGDVAVLALQPLLVEQLQEHTLMVLVHVLYRLRHPAHTAVPLITAFYCLTTVRLNTVELVSIQDYYGLTNVKLNTV